MDSQERRQHPRLREVPVVADAIGLLWRLAESAFTSSLSGLLNKAAFSELDRAARNPQEPALVAFVDLSGFKKVNDEFGHTVGDVLLGVVGRRLSVFAHEHRATAFHLSGDEFAVIFPAASRGAIDDLAAVLPSVDVPVEGKGTALVHLYFGYAPADPEQRLSVLLERAEVASTAAKASKSPQAIAWDSSLESEPHVDPRRRCSECGATTTVLVPAARLVSGAPRQCGNCGLSYARSPAA